jgi:phosphoribosylamine--glycine ligase
MKVLVIGSGGREHALTWKLKQSPGVDEIFCAPGNAGTSDLAENVPMGAVELSAHARFAKQNHIDLTVVGPDDPLALGIADVFQSQGLPIFGPNKSAARLESSKIFAKELMRSRNIPTARAGTFSDPEAARAYCDEIRYPAVIKADGLAFGKGVVIVPDREDAKTTVDLMMRQRRFGEAGTRVVIEEFLSGSECSVHALVDGAHYQLLQTARDHKRVFDGDEGPNTGGMGAVSPASNWNRDLEAQFTREVMEPLLHGLGQDGIAFRGLLFPGLIITNSGAQVLEFNCRFGDPETQAILPRMKSDLLPLLQSTIDGGIDRQPIEWDERVSVTVVMASAGYPDKYEVGEVISGLDDAARMADVQIFHAGTKQVNANIVTAGGRVLAVTALAPTVEGARTRAYEAVSRIQFRGAHYRRDIGGIAVTAHVSR